MPTTQADTINADLLSFIHAKAGRSAERFERKAPRARFEVEAPSSGGTIPLIRPRLHSFVERAQVPDDLARLLWGKQN